jgi:hypothetical protein
MHKKSAFMTQRLTLVSAALLVALFGFTGCKEDGCTDPDAVNYNADAKSDDSLCEWEADVVFWFDEPYANFMSNFGTTQLRVTFDNDYLGAMSIDQPFVTQPTCDDPVAITVTKRYSGTKNRNFWLSVEDQNGAFLDEGPRGVRANECTHIKIDN